MANIYEFILQPNITYDISQAQGQLKKIIAMMQGKAEGTVRLNLDTTGVIEEINNINKLVKNMKPEVGFTIDPTSEKSVNNFLAKLEELGKHAETFTKLVDGKEMRIPVEVDNIGQFNTDSKKILDNLQEIENILLTIKKMPKDIEIDGLDVSDYVEELNRYKKTLKNHLKDMTVEFSKFTQQTSQQMTIDLQTQLDKSEAKKNAADVAQAMWKQAQDFANKHGIQFKMTIGDQDVDMSQVIEQTSNAAIEAKKAIADKVNSSEAVIATKGIGLKKWGMLETKLKNHEEAVNKAVTAENNKAAAAEALVPRLESEKEAIAALTAEWKLHTAELRDAADSETKLRKLLQDLHRAAKTAPAKTDEELAAEKALAAEKKRNRQKKNELEALGETGQKIGKAIKDALDLDGREVTITIKLNDPGKTLTQLKELSTLTEIPISINVDGTQALAEIKKTLAEIEANIRAINIPINITQQTGETIGGGVVAQPVQPQNAAVHVIEEIKTLLGQLPASVTDISSKLGKEGLVGIQEILTKIIGLQGQLGNYGLSGFTNELSALANMTNAYKEQIELANKALETKATKKKVVKEATPPAPAKPVAESLVDSVTAKAPQVVATGEELGKNLVQGFVEQLPILLNEIDKMLNEIQQKGLRAKKNAADGSPQATRNEEKLKVLGGIREQIAGSPDVDGAFGISLKSSIEDLIALKEAVLKYNKSIKNSTELKQQIPTEIFDVLTANAIKAARAIEASGEVIKKVVKDTSQVDPIPSATGSVVPEVKPPETKPEIKKKSEQVGEEIGAALVTGFQNQLALLISETKAAVDKISAGQLPLTKLATLIAETYDKEILPLTAENAKITVEKIDKIVKAIERYNKNVTGMPKITALDGIGDISRATANQSVQQTPEQVVPTAKKEVVQQAGTELSKEFVIGVKKSLGDLNTFVQEQLANVGNVKKQKNVKSLELLKNVGEQLAHLSGLKQVSKKHVANLADAVEAFNNSVSNASQTFQKIDILSGGVASTTPVTPVISTQPETPVVPIVQAKQKLAQTGEVIAKTGSKAEVAGGQVAETGSQIVMMGEGAKAAAASMMSLYDQFVAFADSDRSTEPTTELSVAFDKIGLSGPNISDEIRNSIIDGLRKYIETSPQLVEDILSGGLVTFKAITPGDINLNAKQKKIDDKMPAFKAAVVSKFDKIHRALAQGYVEQISTVVVNPDAFSDKVSSIDLSDVARSLRRGISAMITDKVDSWSSTIHHELSHVKQLNEDGAKGAEIQERLKEFISNLSKEMKKLGGEAITSSFQIGDLGLLVSPYAMTNKNEFLAELETAMNLFGDQASDFIKVAFKQIFGTSGISSDLASIVKSSVITPEVAQQAIDARQLKEQINGIAAFIKEGVLDIIPGTEDIVLSDASDFKQGLKKLFPRYKEKVSDKIHEIVSENWNAVITDGQLDFSSVKNVPQELQEFINKLAGHLKEAIQKAQSVFDGKTMLQHVAGVHDARLAQVQAATKGESIEALQLSIPSIKIDEVALASQVKQVVERAVQTGGETGGEALAKSVAESINNSGVNLNRFAEMLENEIKAIMAQMPKYDDGSFVNLNARNMTSQDRQQWLDMTEIANKQQVGTIFAEIAKRLGLDFVDVFNSVVNNNLSISADEDNVKALESQIKRIQSVLASVLEKHGSGWVGKDALADMGIKPDTAGDINAVKTNLLKLVDVIRTLQKVGMQSGGTDFLERIAGDQGLVTSDGHPFSQANLQQFEASLREQLNSISGPDLEINMTPVINTEQAQAGLKYQLELLVNEINKTLMQISEQGGATTPRNIEKFKTLGKISEEISGVLSSKSDITTDSVNKFIASIQKYNKGVSKSTDRILKTKTISLEAIEQAVNQSVEAQKVVQKKVQAVVTPVSTPPVSTADSVVPPAQQQQVKAAGEELSKEFIAGVKGSLTALSKLVKGQLAGIGNVKGKNQARLASLQEIDKVLDRLQKNKTVTKKHIVNLVDAMNAFNESIPTDSRTFQQIAIPGQTATPTPAQPLPPESVVPPISTEIKDKAQRKGRKIAEEIKTGVEEGLKTDTPAGIAEMLAGMQEQLGASVGAGAGTDQAGAFSVEAIDGVINKLGEFKTAIEGIKVMFGGKKGHWLDVANAKGLALEQISAMTNMLSDLNNTDMSAIVTQFDSVKIALSGITALIGDKESKWSESIRALDVNSDGFVKELGAMKDALSGLVNIVSGDGTSGLADSLTKHVGAMGDSTKAERDKVAQSKRLVTQLGKEQNAFNDLNNTLSDHITKLEGVTSAAGNIPSEIPIVTTSSDSGGSSGGGSGSGRGGSSARAGGARIISDLAEMEKNVKRVEDAFRLKTAAVLDQTKIAGIMNVNSDAISRMHTAMAEFNNLPTTATADQKTAAIEKFATALRNAEDQSRTFKDVVGELGRQDAAVSKLNSLNNQLETMNLNWSAVRGDERLSGMFQGTKDEIAGLIQHAKDMGDALTGPELVTFEANVAKAAGGVKTFRQETQAAGMAKKSFGDTIMATSRKLSSYLVSMFGFQRVIFMFRNMVQYVRDIDRAMVALRRVTDETAASYDRFLRNAYERSRRLGGSIADMIEASAAFARVGYTMEQAELLGDAATLLFNISNVGSESLPMEKGVQGIISVMKANFYFIYISAFVYRNMHIVHI